MDLSNVLKSILILPIIDAIYLNLISSDVKQTILDVQKSKMKFRFVPAVLCYIALIVLLNYFILNTNNTRNKKIFNAFLLGLCVYAVYEMTNYAILENWKLKIVIIDTLWGGILFALTTFLITLEFN
jgi:uncharacterized membrane protein